MMISEPTPFSHSFNFNDITRGIHPLSASPAGSSSLSFFRTTSPTITTTNNNIDDVTTIFVVGFPEDMVEREFQNMFTFCHGFEAASLKWHCKDGEEETNSGIPTTYGGKKQMIGFARFRTRLEALEAIDVLGGKKIDQEKGTVLKAEMAKKNLHIKRASSTTNNVGNNSSTSSSSTSTSTTTTTTSAVITNDVLKRSVVNYDYFSPLPSDLLSSQDYNLDPITFNDSLFGVAGIRSQSFDHHQQQPHHQDLSFMSCCTFSLGPSSIHQHNQKQQQQQQQQQHNNIQQQQQQQHNLHNSIQQHNNIQQQQIRLPLKMMNEIDHVSKSLPDSNGTRLEHDLMRIGSLSIKTNNTTTAAAAAAGTMDLLRSPSSPAPPNPADQNPPCNTLYVGNLPPNTSEEELRQAFTICKGYRRMCFRTKPQGPMCFVEFEDIVFASQALNELQGHQLTNSVKGGIRLSYSKNPLFIKPQQQPQNKEAGGLMSFKQMGNALMSSSSNDRISRDFLFDPQL